MDNVLPASLRTTSERPRGLAGVIALLLVATSLCAPELAQAQAPQEREDEYRALVEQALNEFRLRNWPEARVLFRRAHALSPSARTLRGMGMVSYEMRDYAVCVRELRESLASEVQPLTPGQRREVSELLERALAFVGRFEIRTEPEHARLRVDGEPAVRETDGRILLGLGRHEVTAAAEGYVPRKVALEVEGGEQETLVLRLEAVAADETRVAQAAEVRKPPAPPQTTTVRDGGLRWTWAGLGASLAFGAGTAAVWSTGERKLDDRVAACGDPDAACSSRTRDLELYSTFTTVGWVLTGASVAATVVAATLEWPRERQVQMSLGPGMLQLEGRF